MIPINHHQHQQHQQQQQQQQQQLYHRGGGSTGPSPGSQAAQLQSSHRTKVWTRSGLLLVVLALAFYFIFFSNRSFDEDAPAHDTELDQMQQQQKKDAMVKPDSQLCQEDDAFRYLLSTQSQARCLDGSRPAFYLRKGHGDGKHKWFVYFEGGGWCFDLK
jgi:acetyl esterase/lipase